MVTTHCLCGLGNLNAIADSYNMHSYIKWAQETMIAGGHQVRTIMERCVTELASDQRYKDDARFLRTCIRYVCRLLCS